MVNAPKPVTGSQSITSGDGSFMVTGVEGFYADVMIIYSGAAIDTVTATNPKTGNVYDTATGNVQTTLRYFIDNLSDNLYNVISSTASTWSFKYFITYHRITGVQGE